MFPQGPTGFYVQVTGPGRLLLRGELDMSTVRDLEEKIDEILVPGRPLTLDLAQLRFLDSTGIQCIVRAGARTGLPVVLRNARESVRRTLDYLDPRSRAWVFEVPLTAS